MADVTCTNCLYGSCCGLASIGKCKQCGGFTASCSQDYCKTCAKTLEKCYHCGKAIKYDKDLLFTVMKSLVDQGNQPENSYRELRVNSARAILDRIDEFTNVEQPYAIWKQMRDDHQKQLKELIDKQEKEAEEEWQKHLKQEELELKEREMSST